MNDNLDHMPTRLRAGLIGLLAGITIIIAGLVIILAGCKRAAPDDNSKYGPGANLSITQEPLDSVGAGLHLTDATNTIDPPVAHDSDLPTGAPITTTATPQRVAPATANAETPETTLITVTDNGTVIVPKPPTEDPPVTVQPGQGCDPKTGCGP